MGYYRDLREYMAALEEKGFLVRITREINKDTELMPLVRWQFRGLDESQRKAFLFENVCDAKGRGYSIPVLVGYLASSREIYALGLQCSPAELLDRWMQAETQPVPASLVKEEPVHEEVHIGENLLEHGGLGEFPVPISTPGFDNAPYFTATHWFTRDQHTGAINIGTYRGQIKAPDRAGVCCLADQHIGRQWQAWKALGKPMPAALVLGAVPAVAYVSAGKVPYGKDELAVAGGLVGEPIEVVKCKTIALEVPATAEIVIEGEISTDYLEPEAPFGEYTGYMGERMLNPVFEVKCITHRRNPIFTSIISQMPPSESSMIKLVGMEGNFFKFLKYDCNIPVVEDVAFHEIALNQWCVVKLNKKSPAQVWQALYGAAAYHPTIGKFIIAVDDDIDPRDPESVIWALSFRVQPQHDVIVGPGKAKGLDPSVRKGEQAGLQDTAGSSVLLIDATRKWPYPPVSLPAREYMEKAKSIWDSLGLPALNPRVPWYGYSLGAWTEVDREEAELAVRGDHYLTGQKLAQQRTKV
ncbi:MAG: UbiD family decarboxylase [Clostridia bacterium]|nr:MAG: UbiD family decarboxylase [Clostridia bacterium]